MPPELSSTPSERPIVLCVGAFPPPLHGLSACLEALTEVLGEVAHPVRISTAPPSDRDRGDMRYHLVRATRVLRVLAAMASWRSRAHAMYMTCDAGPGMVYSTAVALWGRMLGYRVTLQHHSFAHLYRRTGLMWVMTVLAGRGCTHVVSCERMRRELTRRYPAVRNTCLVSVAYAIEMPGNVGGPDPRSPGPSHLGHLGNITGGKGIFDLFDVLDKAREDGLPARLSLAGPLADDVARAAVPARESGTDSPVVHLGPLYGEDRERLYQRCGVFLFPSRCYGESFGLAVWEAMLRGIPVIAYEAGCLTQEAIGRAGVVVPLEGDFTRAAARQLAVWSSEPRTYADACAEAAKEARRVCEEARRQARELARSIAAQATAP